MDFVVRFATKNDVPAIYGLMEELGRYEKLATGPQITIEDMCRDGGFNDNRKPLYYCYVVEDIDPSTKSPRGLIGYVLFFYIYSREYGKKVHLQDLFLTEKCRGKGIATHIFSLLAKNAIDSGCNVLTLWVLKWNPAHKLYERLGGKNCTHNGGDNFFRFDKQTLDSIVNNANTSAKL